MKILDGVLNEIIPAEEDMKVMRKVSADFLKKLKGKIKSQGVDAEPFIGGSFAKNTLIKKEHYDLDVFLRFDKKYSEEDMAKLSKKLMKGFKPGIIHGSRDYFRVGVSESFCIEVIPVRKVSRPKDARNITDLSYLHVKYLNKKLKGLFNDIALAKAFCYANRCYGAESYVNGFSGYGLELLVYHYGSFLKFMRAINKVDSQIVIDIEKYYRNKSFVLMEINGSKLNSPIVLIDPTYKERNVLAALSHETFARFKERCKKFLEKPSADMFRFRNYDFEKRGKEFLKKNLDVLQVKIITSKQRGDIAGTKLVKFYNHLVSEMKCFFDVRDSLFEYDNKYSAMCLFAVKSRKELVIEGPFLEDKKNLAMFKGRHNNLFEKGGRIYSKERVDFNLRDFLKDWMQKNSRKMKEMCVENIILVS